VRDSPPDHLWRILRGRNWQVNESRGVGSTSITIVGEKSPFVNFVGLQ
jgi:hypothetical protein